MSRRSRPVRARRTPSGWASGVARAFIVARAYASARATAALALVVLVALVGAGCGVPSAAVSPTASAATPVQGLVVDIVSSGPVDVSSFTVRVADGSTMTFDVGTLEVGGGAFPAEHLGEHRIAAEPVRVFYRDEGGRHVAYRLEDAEGVSPAPS